MSTAKIFIRVAVCAWIAWDAMSRAAELEADK